MIFSQTIFFSLVPLTNLSISMTNSKKGSKKSKSKFIKQKKNQGNDIEEANYVEDAPLTACCICNGTEDEDLTILCDGPNCSKETHMYCLQPPLLDVPEGEWFCDTCDPKGTTRYLEKYFHGHKGIYQSLSPFTPEQYQTFLLILRQNMSTTLRDINLSFQGSIGPSEFEQHLSISDMIGSKLKLFCLIDERYHTGRIIDARFNEDRQVWEHFIQFKRYCVQFLLFFPLSFLLICFVFILVELMEGIPLYSFG
jgi:hypothetical protein